MRKRSMLMMAVLAGAILLLGWLALARAGELPPQPTPLDASAKRAYPAGPLEAPYSILRYEILLANAGEALSHVSLADKLPDQVELVRGSATGGLIYLPNLRTMRWDGALPANSAITLTFEVQSLVSQPMTITNEALICDVNAAVCITRSVASRLEPLPGASTPTPAPTPTPGLDCSQSLPMRLDTPLYRGDTSAGQALVRRYAGAPWDESGPEIVYRLELEAATAVTLTLEETRAELDLFVLAGCDPMNCIAFGDRSAAFSGTAGTYYVVVDGRDGAAGLYALRLEAEPRELPTPPTPTSTPETPTITHTFLPLLRRLHPLPPAPTPTPTPSWPVSLDAVWLEGPKGHPNYAFRNCEVLYQWVRITNHTPAPVPIIVDWLVQDWLGRKVPALSYHNWQIAWPSGTYGANLPRAVPPDLRPGSYSATVRLRGPGGLINERMVYFSITRDEPVTPPLAEFVTSKGVNAGGLPEGATEVFHPEDDAVYAWGWWQRAGGVPHTIRWTWYTPDGSLYTSFERQYTADCTFYAWSWLEIAGTEVAAMPGTWNVAVWYDGAFVELRSFAIGAGGNASYQPAHAGGAGQPALCLSPASPPLAEFPAP